MQMIVSRSMVTFFIDVIEIKQCLYSNIQLELTNWWNARISSAMSKRDRWAGIKGELMGWLALGAIAVVLHLITMAI